MHAKNEKTGELRLADGPLRHAQCSAVSPLKFRREWRPWYLTLKGRRAMLREAIEKEEKEKDAEKRRKEAKGSERENVRRLNAMGSSM